MRDVTQKPVYHFTAELLSTKRGVKQISINCTPMLGRYVVRILNDIYAISQNSLLHTVKILMET